MRGSPDFSFSGLKTALLTHLKQRVAPPEGEALADIAASFQEAICDVLVEKTLQAAADRGVRRVVVCGGVAANSRLRERFAADASSRGIETFIPPLVLCTDNAAMIAVVGDHLLREGRADGYDLNAVSRCRSMRVRRRDVHPGTAEAAGTGVPESERGAPRPGSLALGIFVASRRPFPSIRPSSSPWGSCSGRTSPRLSRLLADLVP